MISILSRHVTALEAKAMSASTNLPCGLLQKVSKEKWPWSR
jgi:hypothetical protein